MASICMHTQCGSFLQIFFNTKTLSCDNFITQRFPDLRYSTSSLPTHMHSLLRCADMLVAEISSVYESTEPILQPRPHTNTLTRAAAIIKVLPHLHMYVCMYVCRYNYTCTLVHVHWCMFIVFRKSNCMNEMVSRPLLSLPPSLPLSLSACEYAGRYVHVREKRKILSAPYTVYTHM